MDALAGEDEEDLLGEDEPEEVKADIDSDH